MISQSAKLTVLDYINLLSLLNSKKPLWTVDSLQRCVSAGLVTPTGNFLSFEGTRKAKRIREVSEKLTRGVPLKERSTDRSQELSKEQWSRINWKISPTSRKHVFFNSDAIFGGRCPWEATLIRSEEPEYSTIDARIRKFLRYEAWSKVIPYAVQIDYLGGMETICFHSVVKSKSVFRIQSKYFDYAINTYKDATFWRRSDGLIRVRGAENTIRDKYCAYISPVIGNWNPPQI